MMKKTDSLRRTSLRMPLTGLLLFLILTAMGVVAEGAPDSNAPKIIRIADFGAPADGRGDAGPAIRKAIDAAVAAGPGAVVELGEGVYRVTTGANRSNAFAIQNARGLTIRGAGVRTQLIMGDPRIAGFSIRNCEGVWLKSFIYDHDPVPFTQGRIAAVSAAAGTFDLELDEGYPSLTEPWFKEIPQPKMRWGMIFDPRERRLKAGAPDNVLIDDYAPLGGRLWRLSTQARYALEAMTPGDRFVYLARGGGSMAGFWQSRECGVEDVTVHASPTCAVVCAQSDAVTVRRLAVRFKPGSTRLITTDADGLHCQQARVGPLMEDCYFEGIADDAINVYAVAQVVSRVLSPTRIVVSRFHEIRPGDLLQILNPREGPWAVGSGV
ncbi:MAG: glycoside hydrolase family 55 protein [bacterium]|nr:glycoside hydrolase family 55 protein [bacterium]